MIIYNIKGQKVKIIPVILSGVEGSGQKYSVTWNGTNDNNQPVSSGIYFYKLRIDGCNIASKKMLLMK
jgi:flagellar hook assembly protein FlgD